MNMSDLVETLDQALQLGESLGLGAQLDQARATLNNVAEREGFPGETFVLALLGGTGVGKSTLLNSIAGDHVSEASVIRPTTDEPRAWLGESQLDEIRPLLDWLGVDQIVAQPETGLDGVAVLDMPDFDSIVTAHRFTVDRLLPRLDALLWVVDPEKYDDERLYEYLRDVGPRAEAFHIVLNKVDRLSTEDRAALSRDLMRRLVEAGIHGAAVHLVSAADGEGVNDLVEILRARAEAKRVVFGKIRADVLSAIDGIAAMVGLDGDGRPGSLLTGETLDERRREAVAAAIDLVDPPGIGRQVASAYLEKARITAGSLLGRLGVLISLMFGVRRRRADPVRYIRGWRSRGDVSRAVNVLRQAYLEATSGMPVEGRAGILRRLDPDAAADGIVTALDSALSASAADFDLRTPLLWRLLFALQLIASGGVIVAALWYLTLWLSPGELPVGTIEIPEVGPVPAPLALLVASLLVSLVVAGLARLHASWLGRRAARRVMANVQERVAHSIDRQGFEVISRLQVDRSELALLRDRVRGS